MKEIDFVKTGEKVYYQKHKSGLDVYLCPYNNGLQDYVVSLQIKYGGAYKEYVQDGVIKTIRPGSAHFLEHKMFEMPYGNAMTKLSSNGCSANAFTSSNQTNYYIYKKNNNKFEEDFKTLLDYVFNLYLNDELVDKEKGIIKEEINMYDNDPFSHINRKINEMLYDKHPLKDDILGLSSDIDEMNAKDLISIYEAFYNPSNMTLVIAGNYPDNVMDIIDNYDFPLAKEVKSPLIFEDKKPISFEEIELDVNDNQAYLFTRMKGSEDIKEYHIRQILLAILFGARSKFKEDYEKNNRLLSFSYYFEGSREYKTICFYFRANNLDEAKDFFYSYFNQDITVEDLEIERNFIKASILKRSGLANFKENFIQKNIIEFAYHGLDVIDIIDSINLEDLKRVQKEFKNYDYSCLYVNKKEK